MFVANSIVCNYNNFNNYNNIYSSKLINISNFSLYFYHIVNFKINLI